MLSREDAFLTVIDVQGKLAEIVADSEDTRRNVCRLIHGARLMDLPIVATEQAPEKLGASVPEVLDALGEVPRLTKVTFSCVGDEGIRSAYRDTKRREAVVCGIESHVCVYQTALDLLEEGYGVHLVTDAVSSRDPANKRLACERLAAEGARLTSTEMVLFEMQRHCEGDRFRELSRLVK